MNAEAKPLTQEKLYEDWNYSNEDVDPSSLLDVEYYMDMGVGKGGYFHASNGDFVMVVNIDFFDTTMAPDIDTEEGEDAFQAVQNELKNALCLLPPGSSGQYVRITHRDIEPMIAAYESEISDSTFAQEIIDSVVDRQLNAALDKDGFFKDISKAELDAAAASELAAFDGNDRSLAQVNYKNHYRDGAYPFVSDQFLVLRVPPRQRMEERLIKFRNLIDTGLFRGKEQLRSIEEYARVRDESLQIFRRVLDSLAGSGMNPRIVTGQGLVDVLYRFVNPVTFYLNNGRTPKYMGQVDAEKHLSGTVTERDLIGRYIYRQPFRSHPLGLDFFGYDGKEEHRYYLRAGSVITFPGPIIGANYTGRTLQMAGTDGEGMITINFTTLTDWGFKIRNRVRSYVAKQHIKWSQRTRKIIGSEDLGKRILEDIEHLEAITDKRAVVGAQSAHDVSLHFIAGGFDEDHVMRRVENFQREFGADNALAEIRRGNAIIHHSLPGNYRSIHRNEIKRSEILTTEGLATLAPIFSASKTDSAPEILMNNRDGEPVFVDIYTTAKTPHGIVIGTTGTGKSFFFNNVLMQLSAKLKPKVWLVDKGRSYESLCYIMGGSYVDLVLEEQDGIKPTKLNMFLPSFDSKTNEVIVPTNSDIENCMNNIEAMLTLVDNGKRPDAEAKAILENSIKEYMREVRPLDQQGTMSEWIAVLKKYESKWASGVRIAEKLTRFHGDGVWNEIFDGYSELSWESDFIVIETERMSNSEALPTTLGMLFANIDMYAKARLPFSRAKLVAVDEAWAAMATPALVAILSGYYREMRKYRCGIWLISQGLGDFVKLISMETADSDGILLNTSNFFLLACTQQDRDLAIGSLGFSEGQVRAWASLLSAPPYYSEVLWLKKTKRDVWQTAVLRLYSSPVPLWISTSHAIDREMRDNKIAEFRKQGFEEREARTNAVVELARDYPYGSEFGRAA